MNMSKWHMHSYNSWSSPWTTYGIHVIPTFFKGDSSSLKTWLFK